MFHLNPLPIAGDSHEISRNTEKYSRLSSAAVVIGASRVKQCTVAQRNVDLRDCW